MTVKGLFCRRNSLFCKAKKGGRSLYGPHASIGQDARVPFATTMQSAICPVLLEKRQIAIALLC
jgi:hypothetical protein